MTIWIPAPDPLELLTNTIHVWRISLDLSSDNVDPYLSSLSPDEKERAYKLRFDRDRINFIMRRGALRQLVSRYTKIGPAEVSFIYNDYGKPFLGGINPDSLHFNSSKSGEWFLIAFARTINVGVDIERRNRDIDYLRLAERYFSTSELLELKALPKELQAEAFFLCWTRKEAYIKCQGTGFSLPLTQFSVNLTPGMPARLLSTHETADSAENWSLINILPANNYCAALAARTIKPTIEYYQIENLTSG